MTKWPPDRNPWIRLTGGLGRAALSCASMRCIASWADLRRRLREPGSILCLGNGPSSEDSDFGKAAFDCLFRVNWVWRERARHANPDLVFTADPDPPPQSPIICFPTREDANRVLAGYVRRRTGLHAEYLVFSELPSASVDRTWPYRPTNGALMLAAAVQLRPRRLVIAGIDLYQHPDGKYPGLTDEANIYDPIHDRDTDLAFIRASLDQFDGEVDIRSVQLRSALQR